MAEEAATAEIGSKRQKQGRSPAYPGISLKVAFEKAKAQYDAEGKYTIPLPSAFKAWGYSNKSSGGRDVRASLRYFGLITVDGDGEAAKVKLTDDALRVLLDEREDQTEKKAIIRRLALNPTVHKRLWNHFPEGIKSNATAAHFLMFEGGGFNKGAAEALIAEFEETAAYAGLYEADNVQDIPELEELENDRLGTEPVTGRLEATLQRPSPLPPRPLGEQIVAAEGERIAFVEESQPGQYLKLIANGEVDDTMLEALEDFVKRQRKRLASRATDTN